MHRTVNLAIITFFNIGLCFSIARILNPPERAAAMANASSIYKIPAVDLETPAPQNIDREITSGWQIILNENFSESWPWSGWTVVDLKTDNKIIYWATDEYRYHSSNKAAWPARGGRDGRDPTILSNDYFNNLDTRMVFGPFDLSNATAASISFWMWWQTETNNDMLKFEVSHDNSQFIEQGRWSGTSTGWQQINISLDQFKGDNSVWVAWRFISNNSIVYDGPWVDDILVQKNVLGNISAHGKLSYTDRDNNVIPAPYTKVTLYDYDYDGTKDFLATTYTNLNGEFQFPDIVNGNDDDPQDQNPNLDLWVWWETIYDDSIFSQHRVVDFGNQTYIWFDGIFLDVPDGTNEEINYSITSQNSSLPAMWIFQDLRNAWEFVYYNTNPTIDPGSVNAIWQADGDSYKGIYNSYFWGVQGDEYIFITDNDSESSDLGVHETGHNYMYNPNGWWWPDPTCWDHQMFAIEDPDCAWSEGWADFFSLVVNHDPCFDWGSGICGSGGRPFYNLEDINRYNQPPDFPWTDLVEGRVAGGLYDLFDDGNEPDYDSATYDFGPIANIVLDVEDDRNLATFWLHWIERINGLQHDAVRALYQNTIDYDVLPIIDLEDINVFENNRSWYHTIDLWNSSYDEESWPFYLVYEITNNPDPGCGITLVDIHYINISPAYNFLGSCEVIIQVSDSLHTGSDTFWVNVIPIVDTKYLPIAKKNN
jgi:hypothetical protein